MKLKENLNLFLIYVFLFHHCQKNKTTDLISFANSEMIKIPCLVENCHIDPASVLSMARH